MTTILYVAGPMTGLPEFNYPAFHEATAELRRKHYVVFNPAENVVIGEGAINPTLAWQRYMRISVGQIAESDGIAYLPGWEKSRGGSFEVFVAAQLGLTIMPVADWLRAA